MRDPFLQKNISEMGIKTFWQDEKQVLSLQLHAPFPTKILENTLLPLVQSALEPHFSPPFTVTLDSQILTHRTQLLGKNLKGIKNTIAVASGKGGVGKSTVTVNLAVALAQAGARVGILDADIYGPSIPTMLGNFSPVGIQGDYYIPVQAHGIQAMSIGYLATMPSALIWRGPMLAKSFIHMLDHTQWDDLDYLFIDLPPGTGDIQLSLVQKIPLTGAIVVTTPQQVAAVDAEKAVDMFTKTNIELLGIIENMSGHICTHCNHHDPVFGEGKGSALSQAYDLPLLAQFPLQTAIQLSGDEGKPIALTDTPVGKQYLKAAMELAILLAKKPLNYPLS